MTAAHAATGLSSRGPHRCLALTFVLGALLTASTVSVSMVPDLHFDGWRWVLAGVAVLAAALAVPVHREAAAELARRRLGPGVLGSLGLVVALAVDDVVGTTRAILSLSIDLVRWFSPTGPQTPQDVAELHARLALRMVLAHDD